MSKTSYKQQILDFYNEFLDNTSINSPESVAWSSHKSQYRRFEVLYGIGVTEADTILDFGCGLGHMVDYLESIGYPVKNYTGIDINPSYIMFAIHRKPEAFFSVGEIYDVTQTYDYILGSGVFTVHMSLDEILNGIDYAFNIANKGVAFNFLTKDFMEIDGFNSFDPDEFYKLITDKYPKTKLVEGYLDNEDFTIYIYK